MFSIYKQDMELSAQIGEGCPAPGPLQLLLPTPVTTPRIISHVNSGF